MIPWGKDEKKNELPLLIVGDSNEGLHAISSKKENVVYDRMKINFNLRWNIEGKILYKSRWKVRSGLKNWSSNIQSICCRRYLIRT
jgi:hypothetical protein